MDTSPGLRSFTILHILLTLQSLSMPNLEIALAENSGVYSHNGIEVESDDGPLVLDFPSLYNASGIKLAGNFKRYHNQDSLFQQLTDPH